MIPIAGLDSLTGLRLAEQTRARQVERMREGAEHQRGIEAWRERAGAISSATALVEDRDLYVLAMKAFDLEDQIFGKAMVRKILESDASDPASLVNRLRDPRFRALHAALDLGPGGLGPGTAEPRETMVERYLDARFVRDQADQNPAVGAALAFKRAAPDVRSPYDILKDPEVAQVVRRAIGLSEAVATIDVDRQARMIEERLDLSTLSDPEVVEGLARRYAILSDALDGPATSTRSPASVLLSGASWGFPDIVPITIPRSRAYG